MHSEHHNGHTLPRQYYFDSLRGIAACMVAIAHFLAAFYPYAVFGSSSDATRFYPWESAVLYPPLSLLTAGHFAVCLFFVLSGYVLCVRIIGEKNQFPRLIGAIVKRPIRLGGVLIFSLLCAGILFEFGGFFHQPLATLNPSSWLTQFWTIDFSWSELAKRIVTFRAGSEYNPPLWTLRIELLGSFLVFGLLLFINNMPYLFRLLILCVCLCIAYTMFSPFYAGFIWGMLLADAHKQGHIKPLPRRLQRIGISLCPLLAAYPYYAFTASKQWAETTTPLLVIITEHISMLAAVAILLLAISSPWLQRALQRRFLLWLGEVSYALYAMHLLIIGSVLAYLQLNASSSLGYGYASLVSVALYIALLLVVSWLVTKFIDAPAVKLANWIDPHARQVADRAQQKINTIMLRRKRSGS